MWYINESELIFIMCLQTAQSTPNEQEITSDCMISGVWIRQRWRHLRWHGDTKRGQESGWRERIYDGEGHFSSISNHKPFPLSLGHSSSDYEYISIQTMSTLPSVVSSLWPVTKPIRGIICNPKNEIISVRRVILSTCDPFCRKSKEQWLQLLKSLPGMTVLMQICSPQKGIGRNPDRLQKLNSWVLIAHRFHHRCSQGHWSVIIEANNIQLFLALE